MAELTKFECDVTGNVFGAKNFVYEVPVRRANQTTPFGYSERIIHLCSKAVENIEGEIPVRTEYLKVEKGEIQGGLIKEHDEDSYYKLREYMNEYEEFFQFLEEEVLYDY